MNDLINNFNQKELSGRDARLLQEWRELDNLCTKRKASSPNPRNPSLAYIIRKKNMMGLPTEFEIWYRCKSIVGVKDTKAPREPIFGYLHKMSIVFPNNYPATNGNPIFTFHSNIWHPNIRYSGSFKGHVQIPKEVGIMSSLKDLVLYVESYLKYQIYHAQNTYPYPEDPNVAEWVIDEAEPNGWTIFSQDETTYDVSQKDNKIDETTKCDKLWDADFEVAKDKKMEQGKEYHINNSIIKIIFGDILDSQAEVIVSSDDCNITMGGGVSWAIRQKEGTEAISLDVKKKVPAEIGDVIVSSAGTLSQKNIFHVITTDYKNLNHSNIPGVISKDDIHQYIIGHSIDKCFQLLHAMDIKSIAFPQIGAGVAGIPFKKVAEVMAGAIGRNLRKTNKSFHIELYLYDRFGKMKQWDFLPMFEQFSVQEAIARLLSEQANDRLFSDDTSSLQSTEVTPDMNKDIFISYSRKDSEMVKTIYEWIERSGYKCWLDADGMFSGVSYKKVIVDAIKRSKVLLFMSSENSNKSRNVVSEVSIAVEYGKKIIPVRLDMSPYSESIEYDIINHDYVVYDRSRIDESNREMLKKIVSTMEMI